MIRTLTKFLVPGVAVLALTPAALADGRNPGSVLVYPIHRSMFGDTGGAYFTAISVTNTEDTPAVIFTGQLGGTTMIHWEYVNVIPGTQPTLPLDCVVANRRELLTPADTRTVLTNCHNGAVQNEGYLVISAEDPNSFQTAWSHNHLVGSELVLSPSNGMYNLNAIPFEAINESGAATDEDGDGQIDFDGIEYEGVAETLYLDVFYGFNNSSLTLINLTGGFQHTANVQFDIWNDNEVPLSTSLAFKCWIDEPLSLISLFFNGAFLAANTAHDPNEVLIDCVALTIETGWARLNGVNASSVTESIPNPALLGALTAGPDGASSSIDGGHLLWESKTKQFNGDFFKTGTDDPEF